MDETVMVFWYDHDCNWVSKYCEEHHEKNALVPKKALESFVKEHSL